MILEPCCFNKQLNDVIESQRETEHLFTFGSVDLPMIMDFLIRHASGCVVHLILVQVSPETINAIDRLMESKDAATGKWLISSLVLISQGMQRKEIADTLGKYRKEGRLVVCEDAVSFRCLCVGNGIHHFVLQGSIPQTKDYAMQMMTLTKSPKHYNHVMSILNHKSK